MSYGKWDCLLLLSPLCGCKGSYMVMGRRSSRKSRSLPNLLRMRPCGWEWKKDSGARSTAPSARLCSTVLARRLKRKNTCALQGGEGEEQG